jgi:hypothetical protein
MSIISINMLLELNQLLVDKHLPFKIHLRDACGKQSLWIEELDSQHAADFYDSFYPILEQYFADNRITIMYSDDKKSFWNVTSR